MELIMSKWRTTIFNNFILKTLKLEENDDNHKEKLNTVFFNN